MLPSLAYLVTSPPECPELGSMLAMVLSLLLTHPLRDLACLCVLCFLTNSCIIMPPSGVLLLGADGSPEHHKAKLCSSTPGPRHYPC